MWTDQFDERQNKEIDFSRIYLRDFNHGTDGHNAKIIIAKMALLLDIADQKISEPSAQELETLAIEAYQAYGQVTGFKNYQGLPMPKWEDLTEKIRDAWRAAALSVDRNVR